MRPMPSSKRPVPARWVEVLCLCVVAIADAVWVKRIPGFPNLATIGVGLLILVIACPLVVLLFALFRRFTQ